MVSRHDVVDDNDSELPPDDNGPDLHVHVDWADVGGEVNGDCWCPCVEMLQADAEDRKPCCDSACNVRMLCSPLKEQVDSFVSEYQKRSYQDQNTWMAWYLSKHCASSNSKKNHLLKRLFLE